MPAASQTKLLQTVLDLLKQKAQQQQYTKARSACLPAHVTLVSDVDDLLFSIQEWGTSAAHSPVRVRGGHRALSRSGRRLAHLRDRHLLHDSAR